MMVSICYRKIKVLNLPDTSELEKDYNACREGESMHELKETLMELSMLSEK